MNVYWCNETDAVVTEEELKKNYYGIYESDGEYETFSDYLMACLWFNNGSLIPLESHIEKVKRDLGRFTDFYDAEETKAIRAEIAKLEKYLEK